MNDLPEKTGGTYNLQPFRRAVFRGFGVILPPLLTILILLWIGNSVQKFVLSPVEWLSRQGIVWVMNATDQVAVEEAYQSKRKKEQIERQANEQANVPPETNGESSELAEQVSRLTEAIERLEEARWGTQLSATQQRPANNLAPEPSVPYEGKVYVKINNGEWIPANIRDQVHEQVASSGIALTNTSGKGYYNYYVEHRVLRKGVVIPVFFAGFILLMYLLGKFLAAGVGRILWKSMEAIIDQLPIIRTVYNSVKQVTDFFVGESDIDFQRVVAVEYPRKGMWSVGFVTGESLLTIRGAADEEVVSVLMPTSPVPGTGFTISVRKSETIDLDIPIEQALQFVVSCGVVVPEGQMHGEIKQSLEAAASQRLLESGT